MLSVALWFAQVVCGRVLYGLLQSEINSVKSWSAHYLGGWNLIRTDDVLQLFRLSPSQPDALQVSVRFSAGFLIAEEFEVGLEFARIFARCGHDLLLKSYGFVPAAGVGERCGQRVQKAPVFVVGQAARDLSVVDGFRRVADRGVG
jgi:hypothetical protein